ncbi:hypothetical protein [Humisphaera borealis]|uniref:Uncharacterized protein n=1 Tax=Humisphaera borealis TaxID=2807512 RepID=A0A7M2WVX6_9BACT|nr:hypothetical protein [Humisphaera borealis]QOV89573.1 hypothetical protein IPV69_25840 [Humisphaera borealis]
MLDERDNLLSLANQLDILDELLDELERSRPHRQRQIPDVIADERSRRILKSCLEEQANPDPEYERAASEWFRKDAERLANARKPAGNAYPKRSKKKTSPVLLQDDPLSPEISRLVVYVGDNCEKIRRLNRLIRKADTMDQCNDRLSKLRDFVVATVGMALKDLKSARLLMPETLDAMFRGMYSALAGINTTLVYCDLSRQPLPLCPRLTSPSWNHDALLEASELWKKRRSVIANSRRRIRQFWQEGMDLAIAATSSDAPRIPPAIPFPTAIADADNSTQHIPQDKLISPKQQAIDIGIRLCLMDPESSSISA